MTASPIAVRVVDRPVAGPDEKGAQDRPVGDENEGQAIGAGDPELVLGDVAAPGGEPGRMGAHQPDHGLGQHLGDAEGFEPQADHDGHQRRRGDAADIGLAQAPVQAKIAGAQARGELERPDQQRGDAEYRMRRQPPAIALQPRHVRAVRLEQRPVIDIERP